MASTIQVIVDDDLKKQSDSLFKDLGTDTATAIRMFLIQAVANNGFPFEIKRNTTECNPYTPMTEEELLAKLELSREHANQGRHRAAENVAADMREKIRLDDESSSKKNTTKKNTVVFIYSENVSSAYAPSIENEIRDIGNVEEVRYYAMQKDSATASWKSTIKEYGYKPILMSGEREKNKIDNKIIRDAKKVVNENKNIDIFVIVSRDGDYTELVKSLRSNHKRVVILAPKKASKKLVSTSSEIRPISK